MSSQLLEQIGVDCCRTIAQQGVDVESSVEHGKYAADVPTSSSIPQARTPMEG